jgi:hypothetical protein
MNTFRFRFGQGRDEGNAENHERQETCHVRPSSLNGFQAIETMRHHTPKDFFCFKNCGVMAGATV